MMDRTRSIGILRDGLWDNNPGFVQLLGLCPLLAVSNTVVNAIGLGLATILTLMASNATVSAIRHWIPSQMRIPTFVLIIASFVTAIEVIMKAWFFELHAILGIFIPLIVTNCIIIGRAEAFAFRNDLLPSLLDGLAMGLGFSMVLVLLGAFREVLGFGTLLQQADLLFGEGYAWLTITVVPEFRGVLLAVLPPGAFLGLGLMVAAKNVIEARRRPQPVSVPVPGQAV